MIHLTTQITASTQPLTGRVFYSATAKDDITGIEVLVSVSHEEVAQIADGSRETAILEAARVEIQAMIDAQKIAGAEVFDQIERNKNE